MSQSTAKTFLTISLASGFSRLNAAGVLIAAFFCIPLMSFTNFIQPYLFTEVFNIPRGEQGALTGSLAAMHEFIIICMMGFLGALSDNIGRRIIILAGLFIIALGYWLYPLADSRPEIFLFRAIIGLGAAAIAAMQTVLLADIPNEKSRGKFLGLASVLTGVGMALLALQAGKLPNFFQGTFGVSAAEAGQYILWSISGLIVCVMVLLFFMIKPGRVAEDTEREAILVRFKKGLAAASNNPRIALSYFVAFASRGDLVIVGTYMTLWVVISSETAGLSSGDGLKRAGLMVAAVQGTALFWAAIMGFLCDRFNRHFMVCIAFALATAAYFTMGTMSDPFDNSIFIACVFLGIGEISTVIAGMALIGQEAPLENRGAVMGVFSLSGGLGILLATFFGGRLFDAVGPTTPFTMMAVVNCLVLLCAVWVYVKTPRADQV
ncbi:MFS transporter [Oceanicoccus sagamiensis]|uniref:Major facilitator superfamily (MFS) profile domain-containing protein n=1 Tax=Oceanicoccus sagamiensis TaxID=716816 RepID=A0A1X9NGL5_9GAMM|nr:MFS transporter [Oceanicoccus sagamiensis]ARN76164.1 hypothetical protein BST96_19905 [Oceanicoccus sagamiensis]